MKTLVYDIKPEHRKIRRKVNRDKPEDIVIVWTFIEATSPQISYVAVPDFLQ